MMTLTHLLSTAHSFAFAIEDGSIFSSEIDRRIWLNDRLIQRCRDNVVSLHGLSPDTEQYLRVEQAGVEAELQVRTRAESVRIDVRECGARGDGIHDDTAAIQAAIAVCPEQGTVLLPEGDWLSSSLFLRSRVHLQLATGARLLGHPDRERWPLLPGQWRHGQAQYVLGSWEGKPATMHAALLNAIGVDDVQIHGAGLVDGNAVAAGWWQRAKAPHRGWRPRLIYIGNSSQVDLLGLHLQDSPCWTVHALRSRRLRFVDIRIQAPLDSPNTDGINPESCADVLIAGARISTGDDCIALKSGKRVTGLDPVATRNVRISQCLMQNGHGAIVIGSEMAGGVYSVDARQCRFENTDRGLRIKTRRGRGRQAIIDGIHLQDIRMIGVGTPFVVNSFYWCDPDGKSPEVGDRRIRAVDEGTPSVLNLSLRNVQCVDTGHCAIYLLGLPEQPIAGVHIQNFSVRFAADPAPGWPDMAAGIEPLARAGLRAWNVRNLQLSGLQIEQPDGPQQLLENVQ